MAVCDLHIGIRLLSLCLTHEWGMPLISQTPWQKKIHHLKLNGFHHLPSSPISVIHSQKHILHFRTIKIQIVTTNSCIFGYRSYRRLIGLSAVTVLENFPWRNLFIYLLFEPFGLTLHVRHISQRRISTKCFKYASELEYGKLFFACLSKNNSYNHLPELHCME